MRTSERKSRGGLTGLLLLLFFAKKTIHIMRETTGLYQWASCLVSLFYFSTNKKKEKERKMMEKEYTCKKLVFGKDTPVIRLGHYCPNHEHFFIDDPEETFIAGPAADKLYAYEELGYSPEELKKMIARLKDLEKTPVTQPASKDDFKITRLGRWITTTNLPDPKPDPITKVYNMAQMEQYFTDRNIKVIRKWGKCGTDTRYTFTLTYAGVTQDYHFTYPDAVVYEERSKQMTKFCEGAYSCFDKYVRDNVRVTYMPARQNGKSLKAMHEMLSLAGIEDNIQKRLYDMVLKGEAGFEDLYPSTMFAPGWPKNNPNVNSSAPVIKDVIFNDPATIVFWNDGSKTVVRAHGGDKFDPEKGLAMAFAKKLFGNNHDYYLQFKRWLKKAKKGPESKKLEAK